MAINPIPLGPSIVVPQQDYSGVGRFFDDLVKQRQEDKAAALLSSYFAGGAPPAEQKSFFGSLIDGGKRALGIEDSSQPAQPTQTASIPQTPGTGAVGRPQSTSSGGIGSDYAARTAAVESGGNPTAKNPRSSASGPYQFTDGTWIENFDKTFPRMAAYSPEQKLAIRDNPKFRGQQDQVFKTFTAGNEAALTKAGVPLDDTARYAAHFFGAGDAPKVLTAPPETPIENIVSPASIEANPFLKGMTAGDARGWLQGQMRATPQAPVQVAQASTATAPATSQMPERLRQFLPALLANPGTRAMAVKMAAQYMGKPTEYGLTPVYGTDAQGNTVLGTIGKDGTFKKLNTGGDFKVSNGIDKIDVGTGYQIRNKRDGTVVGFVPKDLKGAESAKAEGKAQGAARATLPSDLQSGESAVKEIDQLLTSKGFNEVFGSVDQFRPNWTMSAEGKDALTRFNQLKGRAFLQAYSMLKGGGQITEVEGAKAENAMARLDRALSEDEAKAALTDFRDAITTGMQKMRQKAGVSEVEAAAPSAAPPQFSTPQEAWAARKAGKLKAGDKFMTPDGQIRIMK